MSTLPKTRYLFSSPFISSEGAPLPPPLRRRHFWRAPKLKRTLSAILSTHFSQFTVATVFTPRISFFRHYAKNLSRSAQRP